MASELTVSGELDVTELVFPDGTRQSTASTSSIPAIEEPTTYFPAFLTCGDSPESDPMQWTFITGRFQITIDGVQYESQASFPRAVTMDDVATDLQEGIRAATGGQELVQWQTDHFVITSGDTSSSSSITTASAPSVGIDISGESVGNNWMDCDGERALVGDSILNGSADSGKLVQLDASGRINPVFLRSRKFFSSTEEVDTPSFGSVEFFRFEVPGGTFGPDGILRIDLKAEAVFGGTYDFHGYYGDVLVGYIRSDNQNFVDLELDIIADSDEGLQRAILSTNFDHHIKDVAVDSSQNHDVYLTVNRVGGSGSVIKLTLKALTARLIK
ncbi:MAG: hypothetical protein AAGF23_06255 [Acidobacteriota bacterium]